jgi:hypothetical protein
MADSILNGKSILAVDDEPDVLTVLGEEILGAAPKCKFEKAITYEEAAKKIWNPLSHHRLHHLLACHYFYGARSFLCGGRLFAVSGRVGQLSG